jgi:AraC family transcriptional regulator
MSRRYVKYSFSLLNIDHVKLDYRWNYRNVVSPYYRLYYIDEGEGQLSNTEQSVKLEPGYIYMIPSFTPCNLFCPDYLSQYFIQFFEESYNSVSLFGQNRQLMKLEATERDICNFQRLMAINPGRGLNRSDNPRSYEKSSIYEEYEALNDRQSLSVHFETQGIILQLVARFLESPLYGPGSNRIIPQKILESMNFIQLNLRERFSIALLAKRANQHRDYFSRQFLQFTGRRPLAFIHEQRIERAQFLIATTSMSFSEIAAATGFDDLSHFSRIFKKITLVTPQAYRKRIQQEY